MASSIFKKNVQGKVSCNADIGNKIPIQLADYRQGIQEEKGKRILLVSEDRSLFQALKKSSSIPHLSVQQVSNAMEVSRILTELSFDLLLVEANLPWMDGFQLCKIIKSSPQGRFLPIALISPSQAEEDIKKSFDSGCDKVLAKPFKINELLETVSNLLSVR